MTLFLRLKIFIFMPLCNVRDQNLIDVSNMEFINVKVDKRATHPGINFVGIKPVEQANSPYYWELDSNPRWLMPYIKIMEPKHGIKH